MGRRGKKVFSIKLDSARLTEAAKPKYDGFRCGYGVHGDTKYNRRHETERFRKEIQEEYRDTRNE